MAPADLPGAPQQAVIEERIQKRIEYARKIILNDIDDYTLFDNYHRGNQKHPFSPPYTPPETIEITDRSVTNMMRLAVKIPASLTFMEGLIRGSNVAPKEWKTGWVDSGFGARQNVLYTAALKYGQAFVGIEKLGTGKPVPKIYSTKNTAAIFVDPVNDIHPLYLFTELSRPLDDQNPGAAIYMDAERIVNYKITSQGDYITEYTHWHGLGVTPAVRYVVDLDDEGRTTGAVEPLIHFQDAINQGKRNFLLNNNYSAEKVRWSAGVSGQMVIGDDGKPVKDSEGNIQYRPLEYNGQRFLSTSASDAKFGAIDETPADGFIASMEELIREFAVAAQLPPHALLGSMANLSAETLVAALGQTVRFVHTLRTPWGESHRSLLRLVALDIGEIQIGDDYEAEPQWRDMTDRTFSGVVDGLGKLAQMLGIPAEALLSWIPGITSGEMELMKGEIEKGRERAIDDLTSQAAAAQRERRPRTPGGTVSDTSGTAGSGGVASGGTS